MYPNVFTSTFSLSSFETQSSVSSIAPAFLPTTPFAPTNHLYHIPTNESDTPSLTHTVTIRLQPIGSAPQLRQKIFKISSKNRFETVVTFLRNRLFKKGEGGEEVGGGHVFCYVNSVFAPGLDEGVGGLWRVSSFCFDFFQHFPSQLKENWAY